MTVLYIREYPNDVGATIARILKDLHYTLTGSMQPELIWELAVSNCDAHTQTLLECAVSEYVVRGSYTVELSDTAYDQTQHYITRLLATSAGIDVDTSTVKK
jgi:hypothetical protein